MSKAEELLSDLTAASGASRTNIQSKGRLQRSPDYTAARIGSTRPRSDRGVTFHFAHKTISKRGDVSESRRDATSAPSHQAYIERLEAVAIARDDLALIASQAGILRGFEAPHGNGFSYPDLSIEPGRESFGTTGKTKAERVDFWRQVEASEGRTARVQSRIIAELPHETTQKERLVIAANFCSALREKGLPFWATIHSPTKSNDSRNYHLHIAYHDRPAAISPDGRWDFSIIQEKLKKNRSRVETRPFKQNKSSEVRDRNWVRTLRNFFAESNNIVLARSNYEKRLDPRSYKESGIRKEPTEHLGFKSNAAEKFGLDTTRGKRNSRKEFQWAIQSATQRWDELISTHDAGLIGDREAVDDRRWQEEKKLKESLKEGRDTAIKATKYHLLSEAISLRVKVRKKFLGDERKRLASNEKRRVSVDNQNSLTLIDIESEVIENRLPEILVIASQLDRKSETLRKQEESIWSTSRRKIGKPFLSVDMSIFDDAPAYPIKPKEAVPEERDELETVDLSSDIENIFDDAQTPAPAPVEAHAPAQPQEEEAKPLAPTLPGTLLVPEIETRAQLRELNEILMNMSNREVRARAITSRDAAMFLDPGQEKFEAGRGWIVLKAEADKRGVNLETGRQDLSKATDPERAKLHKDESNQSVLEIREEVIRVMSR